MSTLQTKNQTLNQRFQLSCVTGIVLAIVLGIATGYFRSVFIDHAIILVLVGFLMAFAIRKVGHGVKTRFAVISVLSTLVAILISDVIAQFGLAGLVDINAYKTVFNFVVQEDIYSLLWIAYRALALYISYVYARVV